MSEPGEPCESSEVLRPGLSFPLLLASLGTFVLAGVCAYVLPAGALVLALLVPVAIGLAIMGVNYKRKGALRADREGLHWNGAVAIPREGVVNVTVSGPLLSVRTDSSWRPVTRFDAPDAETAARFAAALGRADERPAATLRLGSPFSRLPAAGYFFYLAVMALAVLVGLSFAMSRGSGTERAVGALIALVGALASGLCLLPTRVTLGADGLSISWLGRARWLRWRDLVSVDRRPGSGTLSLRLRSGRVVRLPSEAAFAVTEADAGGDLLSRIQEARQRAHEERLHAVVDALSRDGRSVEAWVAHLRSLGHASGYRALAVSREDLRSAVEDPHADEWLRAAAAVALASLGGRDDVRREASHSASTRVRVALDAAASDDDLALGRALDALEAERERQRS